MQIPNSPLAKRSLMAKPHINEKGKSILPLLLGATAQSRAEGMRTYLWRQEGRNGNNINLPTLRGDAGPNPDPSDAKTNHHSISVLCLFCGHGWFGGRSLKELAALRRNVGRVPGASCCAIGCPGGRGLWTLDLTRWGAREWKPVPSARAKFSSCTCSLPTRGH